jgi:hypothetical protein
LIRYRAAAFWGRLYIPELLVGIHTEEEVVDVQPVTVREAEPAAAKASLQDLNAKLRQPEPVVITEEVADDEIF